MAITVTWAGTNAGRIYIPKADTTYVGLNPFSQEIRSLDVDALRLTLRGLEDDPDGGRPWPRTHRHETQTDLAGINYVRKVIFFAPYYFEFEAGNYRVNLSAENNNLVDRLYFTGVTVVPANSAGGQVVETGVSGLTAPESAKLLSLVNGLTVGELVLLEEIHRLKGLDIDNPLIVTPTSKAAGSISQTISGDGEMMSTVQRT